MKRYISTELLHLFYKFKYILTDNFASPKSKTMTVITISAHQYLDNIFVDIMEKRGHIAIGNNVHTTNIYETSKIKFYS